MSDGVYTGYELALQISLLVGTICRIWLLPRLSVFSCFLPRKWLPAETLIMSPTESRGRLPRVSAGSHLSFKAVSAANKRSPTFSEEAKCYGQSQQEAKLGGLV